MANNKNDILSTITSLLNNVDLGQVLSLISGMTSNKKNSSNSASAFANLDLGKISEVFSNIDFSEPKKPEKKSSFFGNNNYNNNNNEYGSGIFGNGNYFNGSGIESLLSQFSKTLQGFRNFRF